MARYRFLKPNEHANGMDNVADHARIAFDHVPDNMKSLAIDLGLGQFVFETFTPLDAGMADHLALEEIT